jgi:gas vesicle protein
MAALLVAFCMSSQAQGFLKKLENAGKKVEKAVEKVDKVTQDLDKAVEEADGTSQTTTTTAEQDSLVTVLLKDPGFQVRPTYQLDENNDTIRNEDGTKQVRYIVYDNDGKACSVDYVQQLVKQRSKQYHAILLKVGGGAAAGALIGGLKKGWKGALVGGAAGGAAGLLFSANNIKKIRENNETMKSYKSVVEAYQKTFTEEGFLIDANVDLSNVDGIDFSQNEAITKSSAEIIKELNESKESATSLDDIDLTKLGLG